jgi:hypothetical protein
MSARKTRRNAMARKSRRNGVFGYVARPVRTLAKGTGNVAGKTVKHGVNAASHLVSHASDATQNALHNVAYGASNILDTGARALNRTVSNLFGKARKAARKSRKIARKSRKMARKH